VALPPESTLAKIMQMEEDEDSLDVGTTTVDRRLNHKSLGYPVGQLNWIGGFSNESMASLSVNAYTTPAVRCVSDRVPYMGRTPITTSISLTSRPYLKYVVDARALARVKVGDCYFARRALGHIPNAPKQPRNSNQPELRHVEQPINIHDSSSDLLAFPQLREKYPSLSELINGWAKCPDDVAFFLVRDNNITFIFPTSVILAACYIPSGALLANYLADMKKRPYFSDRVAFTGLQYWPSPDL
jgi:hypothetical protein